MEGRAVSLADGLILPDRGVPAQHVPGLFSVVGLGLGCGAAFCRRVWDPYSATTAMKQLLFDEFFNDFRFCPLADQQQCNCSAPDFCNGLRP